MGNARVMSLTQDFEISVHECTTNGKLEVVLRFDVHARPTFVMVKVGKPVDKVVGMGLSRLEQMIRKNLTLSADA